MTSAKCKILVVDDNESIRHLLKTTLNNSSFDVVCAEDVLEAFFKFIGEPFDLVLTDIFMPGINGNTLARYIRNLNKEIPIIAITGVPEKANACFDLVIEKPFELKFLLDSINYYRPDDKEVFEKRKLQACL